MDFFELAKDIVRADHQRKGLPSPDGIAPTEIALELLSDAERFRDPTTNPGTLVAKGIEP